MKGKEGWIEGVDSWASQLPWGVKGDRGCVDYPLTPTPVCRSQLSPAFESQLWTPPPAPPQTSHSVISYWWLEIGHGGRVYTTEIGKCYKAGHPSPFGKPAVTHLPAHLWVPWEEKGATKTAFRTL